MRRLLLGLFKILLLYALVCASFEGVVRGVDASRSRMENRFEDRYGSEVVDREPPYSWRERLIVALDIQPSMYWQESAGMSALAGIPVTIGLLGATVFRVRSRRAFFMLSGIVLSGTMLYMLYRATHSDYWNISFVGYLVESADAAFLTGLLAGFIQGWVASLIYPQTKVEPPPPMIDLSNGAGHFQSGSGLGESQAFDHRKSDSEGGDGS